MSDVENDEREDSIIESSKGFKPDETKILPVLKIQIFKGLGDKIGVENWLKRFETVGDFYGWNPATKCIMLANYLEDDALNWSIETSNGADWDQIKTEMISRFGCECVDPLVGFVDLLYDPQVGFKTYFENKRRLGMLAKLTEQQVITLLVHGLTPKMKDYFLNVKPKTFSECYVIGKSAEQNQILKQAVKPSKFKPNNSISFATRVGEKRKPPTPCRICDGLGFKNRYHWGSDCRNRNRTQNEKVNVNVITNDTFLNEEIACDIPKNTPLN